MQLERLAFKLLTKVFRLSFGIQGQTEGHEELTLTPKLSMTALFLKQSLLHTTKYSQKFTFNFIKLFKHPGQSGQLNFNELNLRKCLTL
jgi:hypothetical protein